MVHVVKVVNTHIDARASIVEMESKINFRLRVSIKGDELDSTVQLPNFRSAVIGRGMTCAINSARLALFIHRITSAKRTREVRPALLVGESSTQLLMYSLDMYALDTPLIYACRTGRSGIIAMLINNGANPNATNRRGLTPLMYAVESGSVEAVKNLLNGGAQTCLVEPVSQWTALFVAAKCGNVEIVKLLLSFGANANLKDKDGMCPLEVAQVHGHSDVCIKLETEGQLELNQSKNFQNIQKQVFATTLYIHRMLESSYQKLTVKQSDSNIV